MEPRVGLAFGDELTGCIELLANRSNYRDRKVIQVGLLLWHPGQEWLHLESRKLFQHMYLYLYKYTYFVDKICFLYLEEST